MNNNLIKLIDEQIECGNIRVYRNSVLPLRLLKYTQECVFNRSWNEATIMARGLVIDDNYNVVCNCIPKFFNYEENYQQLIPSVDINQTFTATKKDDGSLIQVFMYNGKMVITSSGGFDNDYTETAKQLLNTTYEHLLPIITTTDRINFIFELISPLTTVVVNYGNVTQLKLITIRDYNGNEDDDYILQCKNLGFDYVDTVEFKSIKELVDEKSTKFKNIEGYVLKFADGSRLKFKYDEYFTLHKTVAHVSKAFVWEYLSNGMDVDLTNIPDETFKLIEMWKDELNFEFNALALSVQDAISDIYAHTEDDCKSDEANRKKIIALYINENHKNMASIMFRVFNGKPYSDLIWKSIKPARSA